MRRMRNLEALLQGFLCLLLAIWLVVVWIQGGLQYYVHPRFYIGIIVSAVILLGFAGSYFWEARKPKHIVVWHRYIIYVLPLLGILFFSAVGTGSGMSLASTIKTASDTSDSSTGKLQETTGSDRVDTQGDLVANEDSESAEVSGQEQTDLEEVDLDEDLYAEYLQDGVYVIPDEVFAQWYMDLFSNLESWEGRQYRILAQVYHLEEGEPWFLAGRYFMVCCAADLVGYGVLCEIPEGMEYAEDTWIEVTGTLQTTSYNGYDVPLLIDPAIELADKPSVEYVYF